MSGIKKSERVFVAGHQGLVGTAVMRLLQSLGFENLITTTKEEVDLRDARCIADFLANTRPEYVFLCAARVGGIQANRLYPADFIYDNLMIQSNVIHQSCFSKVKKVVFLGSSCMYPRECPQPMKEEYLMSGSLEPTNEGYAIAKIAGLKMAQYYQQQYGLNCLCVIPCNLYGPNDSFDPQHSHVLSALIKKFIDAAEAKVQRVTLWGSGRARREFLHVDDLASALLFLMDEWNSSEAINIGSGEDISIRDLAELIARKIGFTGKIEWDTDMPDGMVRKCLDISKLRVLGYRPSITLEKGIDQMIEEYRASRLAGK